MKSATALVLIACVGVVGCATLDAGPPDTAYQATLGEVAIVATEQSPTLGFHGFAHGKGEGALTGAGGTFAACLSGGGGGCSGAGCGAALLLILGICGVAGLVGGIAGAAEAPDASAATASEARLAQAVEIRTVQAALRDQVFAAAQLRGAHLRNVPPALAQEAAANGDYRSFAAFGVDSVVETGLVEAGTRGSGINAPVGVHLRARVRVLATADNGERLVADYLYQGRHRRLAEWAADDGRPLKRELDTTRSANTSTSRSSNSSRCPTVAPIPPVARCRPPSGSHRSHPRRAASSAASPSSVTSSNGPRSIPCVRRCSGRPFRARAISPWHRKKWHACARSATTSSSRRR